MPANAEILNALAEILNEVADVDPADVTSDKRLGEDLDVDSLAMVEVAVALEERFGVRLQEEEIKKATTVGEIVAVIESSMAAV